MVDLPDGTTVRQEFAAVLRIPGQPETVSAWTTDRAEVDAVLDPELPVVGLSRWVYETPAEPLTDTY